MEPTLDPLVLDLVEWVALRPRRHAEVMEAWRTSCPRLTVWEEAVDRGYVVRRPSDGGEAWVMTTDAGLGFLRRHGRAPATSCDGSTAR
jgi:hypothetical protein